MSIGLRRRMLVAFCLVAAFAMTATSIPAQTGNRSNTQKIDRKKMNEATSRAQRSARVITQTMSKPDSAIPRELIDRAAAVAVFPGVFSAAFGLGGRGGKGVISRRLPNGTWSAPAYFNMAGGSFGAQIGAKSTDYVLLIMNEDGIRGLVGDKFTLGTDASVAAGPVGRTAEASTNLTLDAGILSYSRSKGLFAGVSLNGVVINPDNDLNRELYGVTAQELLTGDRALTTAQVPNSLRVFPQTLARY